LQHPLINGRTDSRVDFAGRVTTAIFCGIPMTVPKNEKLLPLLVTICDLPLRFAHHKAAECISLPGCGRS